MHRIPVATLIALILLAYPAAAAHKSHRGDATTLGDLDCTAGQVAMFDGTVWVCADLFAPKLAFVTSDAHQGDLGGLIGADAKCQGLADAVGLGGTYRAWLSDSSGSPATRFVKSFGPYVRTDGEVIANNWTDLTDGAIAVPISVDESGFSPPIVRDDDPNSPWHTWTATKPDGTRWQSSWPASPIPGEYCQDWTINVDTTPEGGIGYLTRTDSVWTECVSDDPDCEAIRNSQDFGETRSCDNPMRLYCFEQ